MTSLVTGAALPAGWTLRPLKYLAAVNAQTLPDTHPSTAEIAYVDIGAVGHGRFVALPEVMAFGEAPSRARRIVHDGDILVSTVRTYLRAVVRIDVAEESLIASTGFAVITPEYIDGGFL